MTWDTIWNISKLTGLILGSAAVITLIVKVFSSATKEKIIELLEKELSLAREHVEQCDRDVKHYRVEMHDVRSECQAKIASADGELHFAREKLREIEMENARLMSQTDLSPIAESLNKFIKEQTEINAKVLEALQKLLDNGTK